MKNNNEIIPWDLDYDISESLSIGILTRTLDDAKDRFKSIENSFKIIKSRAFTILAILLSIIGVIITSLLRNIQGLTTAEYKSIYLLICAGLLITIFYIFKLVKIIRPKKRIVIGELPSKYKFKEMSELPIGKQEAVHLISDLESYDYNIKYNEYLLQKEIDDLESTIRNIPLLYTIILLISFLIIIIT